MLTGPVARSVCGETPTLANNNGEAVASVGVNVEPAVICFEFILNQMDKCAFNAL